MQKNAKFFVYIVVLTLLSVADAWGKKKEEPKPEYSYTLEMVVGGFFATSAVLTTALALKKPSSA